MSQLSANINGYRHYRRVNPLTDPNDVSRAPDRDADWNQYQTNPVEPVATVATQSKSPPMFNPTPFRNEWERKMGMSMGMGVDGDFSEDALRRRQMSTAIEVADETARNELSMRRRIASPINYSLPDDKLAQAQMAGDQTGFVKRFLTEQNMGQDYEAVLNYGARKMPDADLSSPIVPYRGVRPQFDAKGNSDALDTRITNHPEFMKLIASNPKEAAEVYRRLTQGPTEEGGRDLDSDRKSAGAFETSRLATIASDERARMQAEQGEAFKNMSDGAYHDTQTARWMVPTTVYETDSANPTATPRPRIMQRPSSEFVNDMMNRHGWDFLGRTAKAPDMRGAKEWDWRQQMPNSVVHTPRFQKERQRMEGMSGMTLSPDELNFLASMIETEELDRRSRFGELDKMQLENHNIWKKVFGKAGIPQSPMMADPNPDYASEVGANAF